MFVLLSPLKFLQAASSGPSGRKWQVKLTWSSIILLLYNDYINNLRHYLLLNTWCRWAEIERLYPPGDLTDRSHACVGNEEIILSCRGSGQNITWTATSDSVDIGRIVFFNSDTEGTLISQGIIRGFLIDVDSNNNLVSELRVTPTPSMRPISITCSSQTGRSSHIIAPPGTYTHTSN